MRKANIAIGKMGLILFVSMLALPGCLDQLCQRDIGPRSQQVGILM